MTFGFNPGHNNGNVQQIANYLDSSRSTTYTYDSLNRISQANTTTTTGPNCWGESYTIDAWGNLTHIAGVSSMTGCHTESQNVPVSANNRITGWCYDGAGNLLDMGSCAPVAQSFVYDAEGHLQSPPGPSPILNYTYYYDGSGNRVQKCNANPCTSGSTTGTLYWLGAGGEVLDESSRTGTMQEEYIYFNGQRIARRDLPSGSVHYYFSNHLGSASVITDSSGNIQQQTDYYPYGGIAYTAGSDPNHFKFTGKERDIESGLDNFGARFDASSLGRFMTPDLGAMRLLNPQSLNRYTHVLNNPLRFVDPDGNEVVEMGSYIQTNYTQLTDEVGAFDSVFALVAGGSMEGPSLERESPRWDDVRPNARGSGENPIKFAKPEHPAEEQGLAGAWFRESTSAWSISVDFNDNPLCETASIKFSVAPSFGAPSGSKGSQFLSESQSETKRDNFRFKNLSDPKVFTPERLVALAEEAQKQFDRTGDERYAAIADAVWLEQAKRKKKPKCSHPLAANANSALAGATQNCSD